ncbi:hypothetical protein DNU06_09055 [Putridiphycobacter roseus]|uniref:Uncharacterized protein n=1 Tax=Putridiphycobacter roseus TaxID=2219161 RepID=A0A2W1NRY8_9FLAO|nr:hypothetical protein [Putridiphycobacter roseus]PZE17408.1 hypothetical protein DNU06_09055 [Putridiphycobacter roseus]
MKENTEKPSAEAKALSLFLMAFKTVKPIYKEQSKRLNRLWNQVVAGDLSMADYMKRVQSMLTLNGGYDEVLKKTVRFYMDKSGEWKLKGEDKYCVDAQKVADEMMKK